MAGKGFLVFLSEGKQALVVSLTHKKIIGHTNEEETYRSLEELKDLLRTLGIGCAGESVTHHIKMNPATVFSEKRLLSIKEEAGRLSTELLVFDMDLSPAQVRNIKKISQLEVLDRNSIILEIFAGHARTRESQIQIEMARLQYLLPRLSDLYGIQGAQNKQDKQAIRQRLDYLRKKLQLIGVSREQQDKKRQKETCIAALVGYTNAGKSSLLNRLCQETLPEGDKFFSTVEVTHRILDDRLRPPILLVDTVGFIANLPKNLQQGFRTTLASALAAQLLVMVCDVAHPHAEHHIQVTEEILRGFSSFKEAGILYVFNKKDLLPGDYIAQNLLEKYRPSILVSSFNPQDMATLKEAIRWYFLEQWARYYLYIPYARPEAQSLVLARTNVIQSKASGDGILYEIRVCDALWGTLDLKSYLIPQDDPRIGELERHASTP